MRVPVVDSAGRQLLPCTPPKARHLLKQGQARARRCKLGIFYIQLVYEVPEPSRQQLVVGVDPGSTYEGYSVVGNQDTVLNIMAEAPTHVKKAVEVRRTMRRARRHRKLRRRPIRRNRLCHKLRIPPSTRSRWEAKHRIVKQLCKILPITDVVIEDVKVQIRGQGQWANAFSPVQVGKEHLYHLLESEGLKLHLCEGHETAALRQGFGLTKTKQKDKRSFDSHCVDAWVMAAAVSGASRRVPSGREKRLWYITTATIKRRMLHKLQPAKGGVRRPEGGSRSLGLKRATLVRHPKYGLCSVGGWDRKNKTISLHDYCANERLTKVARGTDLRVLTASFYRAVFCPA
jgi:hypothetical protein